jgi:predicted ribosome quality control (RQC) complex YloA/Tae2 family protein
MPLESHQEFQKNKQALLRTYKRSLKRVVKSHDHSLADLQKCLNWESVHHLGELLQANLYKVKKGASCVSVEDWLQENHTVKLSLDPLKEPHAQVSELFRRARKLKAGIPHMEKQVIRMQAEIDRMNALIASVEAAESEEVLETLKPAVKPKKELDNPIVKRYREYFTASGLSIWVGKSARDNDVLTFRLAKGSDWWFHVSDFPGSHVILRVSKNTEPDAESIKDAMQVALHHSKAKERGEAEVCMTQCKYVARSGRNQPGLVQISKHKTMKIVNDSKRFQELKQRKLA